MSSTATAVTVLPTARPWKFAAIAASAGGATVSVGYNANKTDGSGAGGSSGLNSGFTYGAQHGNVGETDPHTIAVVPGALVSIKYASGTVKKDAGGTLFGPRGDTTAGAGISPTSDFTDASGYVYPSNCMPLAKNESLLNPTIGRVGLCGCFTDALGSIIANSFWDWKSKGGTDTANSSISLKAPAGAAFVSIGVNDTVLSDNGGAGFTVTVFMLEPFDFTGDMTFVPRYPVGLLCPGFTGDSLKTLVYLATSFTPNWDFTPNGLQKGYGGQIFPSGAFASGGGQVFPY